MSRLDPFPPEIQQAIDSSDRQFLTTLDERIKTKEGEVRDLKAQRKALAASLEGKK